MTPTPTVSVIIWSRAQPRHLARSLASVAAAAAHVPEETIELVLVNDGEQPIDGLLNQDERVRYLPGPAAGVGAARTAGLAAARGAFIAYCDDGDEWLPDHLRVLLDALRAHPEVSLVYGESDWRDPNGVNGDRGPAIELRVGAGEGIAVDRIQASTVLHRAEAARDVGGFDPSLHVYADIDLWLRMDEAHLLQHVPIAVTIHDRPPDVVGSRDRAQERERLLGLHHRRRTCRDHPPARRSPVPFAPATWRPPRRELHWQSPLNRFQSFGLVGRQLLTAVERAGVDVTLASSPPRDEPAWRRLAVDSESRGRIGLSYDYWHRPDPLPADLLVTATMCEGTFVPKARVNAINQTASLLYVPCRQNRVAFADSGVRVPIRVLPYGVDPARFPYLDRARDGAEPFTFGTFGALSLRKGADVLVRAFREEFAPAEPVRLLLKSVEPLPFVPAGDSRIRVLTGFWADDALLELLRGLDAFVLPSRAEGFGLCGLEAMATGLPTIATDWSGPSDYLDSADSLPLQFRLVDAAATEANGVRYFGEWAEPDVEHLRSRLRWLYEHREDATRMGRLASARVHRDWTWDRVGGQIRDDLDLLASGISPA